MSDKRVVDNFKSLPQQVIENTEYILSFEDRISGWDDKINSNVEKVNAQDSKISALDTKVGTYDTRIESLESSSKSQISKITSIESKDVTQDSKIAALETDVNAISNNYVSTNGPQDITGVKTFTQPIKSNEIDNTNGTALVKSSTSGVEIGNTSQALLLKGSTDHAKYNDNEIALKKEVDNNWDLLMANLGIGRWENNVFYDLNWTDVSIFCDDMMSYYTNLNRFMSKAKWFYRDKNIQYQPNVVFQENFIDKYANYSYAFYGVSMNSIELPNLKANSMFFTFAYTSLTKISIKEGCKAYIKRMDFAFAFNSNLVEIGSFNLSECTEAIDFMYGSPNIKSIHCTHWKVSFDISPSTAFEESDLVEIISNLDEVSTTQTLTMGATNLAKLTDEEKKVATDKGWVLA